MTPTRSLFRLTGLIILLTFAISLAIPLPAQAQAAAGPLAGVVATQSGTIRLGGAQIVVRDAAGNDVTALLSDGDGRFQVASLPVGKYTIVVSLEGFTTATVKAVVAAGQPSELAIDLPIAALTDTVTVVAPVMIVSTAETLGKSDAIGSKEADQLSPGGGLQSALRLLASVIEVPGGVSIKGGRPTQAGMQLGAATLTDPAMGLVHFTLPDGAIDSVAVLPNPYAVEYGRFSSGLVVIQTRRASDQWKVRLNNLDPTFRSKRHQDLYNINGISGWGPRLELGGPLVKNRLFLEQSAQYRYSTDDVPSRPEDERRTTHWFSSFSRADANLTPKHSLVAMGGFFPSVTTKASLGTFTPPDATVDVHDRVNHGVVTERALWRDTLVGESTVQIHTYRTELAGQGTAAMQLWPDNTLGNFFNTQRRTPSTIQAIETLSGSADGGRTGLHLFKVGVDLLHNRYDGSSSSRPVLIYRADGTLARRLDFAGLSTERVRSTDVAFFAQDRVQPTTRWYAEYGARVDRDGVVRRWNVTPRVGAALLLNESGSAVLRGGYGLFYERTPSAAGAFEQFESALDTRFAADGITPLAPGVRFVHVTQPDLRTARSSAWDLSYDHRLSPRWTLRASLLDRHGSHELIVDPRQTNGIGELRLSGEGRSRYRDAEVGFHYTRSPAADLNVSYAHATAQADLNPFAAFFDTMMSPVIGPNVYGPSATDVPHRLLARGRWMPTPHWLLVGVTDLRTGFPYSAVDEALDFVGPRNSRRFPIRFRQDLGIEHRFHILKWEPWIGVRAYNALSSFLPSDVQANIGSKAFGTFYNSEYRQFRLQLRFER
ncbi:MAG TPA: TonB-dependent receptor [Vicinamibacterales bacterium]|nr:TonB-dependent receptor [Vicinamibacterales bacterium]